MSRLIERPQRGWFAPVKNGWDAFVAEFQSLGTEVKEHIGYVDPDRFWQGVVDKVASEIGPEGGTTVFNKTDLIHHDVDLYIDWLEGRSREEQAYSLEAAEEIILPAIEKLSKPREAARLALRDLLYRRHQKHEKGEDGPEGQWTVDGLLSGIRLRAGHRELARVRMATQETAQTYFLNLRSKLLNPTTGARGAYDCSGGLLEGLHLAMQDARNHGDEAYARQVLAHARTTFITLGSRTPAESDSTPTTPEPTPPGEGSPTPAPRRKKAAAPTPVAERTESRQAFQVAYETVSLWLIQHPSKPKDKAVPGIAKEAGKSIQEAKAYWKAYTDLALDPVFGYKQDYSVTPTLEAEHKRVMDHLPDREWEAQRHFIAGGITALLEAIETTDNADENAWLTRQVLHLVADSPIAEALKANEGDQGTRETRTREVVIKFLVASIFRYGFDQDGLTVEGNQPPREKVLIALGNFIATDAPKLITPDQRLICQLILNARLEYLVSSAYRESGKELVRQEGLTPKQADDIKRAFIFGTEGIISLVQKGDYSILHTFLTGIRLIDPLTFMALVRNNPAFRVQLEKMARSETQRWEAAHAALAQLGPDASPQAQLLEAWKAGAKIVEVEYHPFPKDTDLKSIDASGASCHPIGVPELIDAAISNDLMLEMLSGMRMFSGVGPDGGTTFALDAEHANNPVAAQLFHHYIQILRQMVESPTFNQGETRLQHLSGMAFLMWGHMLREAPDTNEDLKETERAAFFDRLIDVLRHPSQYGQPVVDAAHRVLYQCLPYYSQEAIGDYVDRYLRIANHHDATMVEGGRLVRYLKALAVHKPGYWEIPGTKDMLRPFAPMIAAKLVAQLELYSGMEGDPYRLARLILFDILGKGIARIHRDARGKAIGIEIDPALYAPLHDPSGVIVLKQDSFSTQVFGAIAHIGDDKAKGALREALAEALRREMPLVLEITDPQPERGQAFIDVADEAAERAREALELGFQSLARAVAQLAAMSQPVLAQAQSELAVLRDQEDVVAVLEALEEEQATLTAATPQKDMEEAVRRLIARAAEVTPADGITSIQQTLQLIREELPLASLEQLTDVVKQIYSLPEAAGTSEQLSLTDAITLVALVYSQTVVGSERGAAMEQVAALLRDQLKVVTPEMAGQLAALTGTIEVPKAMAVVQAQAIRTLGGTLEHLEELATIVEQLQTDRETIRAARIRELEAIQKQLNDVGDDAATKTIAATRRVIDARIALVERHAEEVEGILAGLKEQHARRLQALGELITMRDAESQANLDAFVQWLKHIWGADGRANALLRQLKSRLRAQGFYGPRAVLIEAPTVKTILGEESTQHVQDLQRKALPEAVTR